MSASRIVILVLLVAVLVVGGASAAYLFLSANTSSNRGLHLLVSVDAAELRNAQLTEVAGDARQRLRDARIAFDGLGVVDGAVKLRVAKPEEVDAAVKALRAIGDVEVGSAEGGNVILTLPKAGQDERLAKGVGTTVEVLRRRCDAAGIVLRSIAPDGPDRLRIHAANPADAARLKEEILSRGELSLHEVHPSQEAQSSAAPAGYRLYPTAHPGLAPMLLRVAPAIRGDDLADAQAAFDARTNEPVISFRFNTSGARKFGLMTQANVGRPVAIVIDGKVFSAPVVREPILGGSGQISGNFTPAEAQRLAIRLRSGALPARLTIIEERVVTQDE
jgi:protein-export membrane protein SecD